MKGYLDIVKLFIDHGLNIDSGDRNGSTPLHFAAQEGHFNVVKFLLEKGAEVRAKTKDGDTALHYASQMGHIDVVRFLVKHNADIKVTGLNGITPLHWAAIKGYPEILKFLAECGADLEAKTTSGDTALHLAAETGRCDLVKILLECGADIMAVSESKCTALHAASNSGHIDVIRILLESGVDIEAEDESKCTALDNAAHKGHVGVVKVLLESGANIKNELEFKYTALHWAIQEGYVDVVKVLLESGADIEAKTEEGYTPLHIAAAENRLEIVRLLVKCGAKINSQDQGGSTPLHLAVEQGFDEVIECLLDYSVDINAQDQLGNTPLDDAILEYKLVPTLLLSGAGGKMNVQGLLVQLRDMINPLIEEKKCSSLKKASALSNILNALMRSQETVAVEIREIISKKLVPIIQEAISSVTEDTNILHKLRENDTVLKLKEHIENLLNNDISSEFLEQLKNSLVSLKGCIKDLEQKSSDPSFLVFKKMQNGIIDVPKLSDGAKVECDMETGKTVWVKGHMADIASAEVINNITSFLGGKGQSMLLLTSKLKEVKNYVQGDESDQDVEDLISSCSLHSNDLSISHSSISSEAIDDGSYSDVVNESQQLSSITGQSSAHS